MNLTQKSTELLRECRKNPSLMKEIVDYTQFLDENLPGKIPMRQRLYHYILELNQPLRCGTCNKTFLRWNIKEQTYRAFCSSKCAHASESVKEKTKNTCLAKYGEVTNLKSEETKQKIQQTNLKKYGVDNFAQSERFKQKFRETCLKRYGVENPSLLRSIREKIDQTHMQKYGRKRKSQEHISTKILELKDDKEFMEFLFYEEKMSLTEIARILGVNHSQLCVHFRQNLDIDYYRQAKSTIEKEIEQFLSDLGLEYESNNRSLLGGMEIDIYFPSKAIGIEIDGLYWHSDRFKDKSYHKKKDALALEKGVTLVHVTDYEWINKKEIVKSRLKAKLGLLGNRIFARRCEIVEVSSSEAKEFLNENHIQGFCPSRYRYGLVYNNDLVSLMTFGKPRFNSNYQFELLRYVTKKDLTVVGGPSRLLKYFTETHSCKSIVSYSDVRWNTGGLYARLGFRQVKWTDPNYWYTKNTTTFESRMKYQKHKLPSLLAHFDPARTEYDNMVLNGYSRYYDSGNIVWAWHSEE